MATTQIDRICKLAIRKHFTHFEANFPLNRRIALGDYGPIENGYFIVKGNIYQNFSGFVPMDVRSSEPAPLRFDSAGAASFKAIAKGETISPGVVSPKAAIQVSMNSANNFCLVASGVVFKEILNIDVIGRQLLGLYNEGHWEKKNYLVSKLYDCGSAVIAVSTSKDHSLTLDAGASVTQLNLADTRISLQIGGESGAGFSTQQNNAQFAMGLCRIYDSIFIKPTIAGVKSQSELAMALDESRSGTEVFGEVTPAFYENSENYA
jgi:hypothetical protein